MPLLILVGLPCSGKSERCRQIKECFETVYGKAAHVVSEENVLRKKGLDKNAVCLDTTLEKAVRSEIKAEIIRLLSSDLLIIVDAGNYIKGYRYELYCAAKSKKSTQCTVECEITARDAWSWNEAGQKTNAYTKEAFDALVTRYEAPNGSSRWDSPLFKISKNNVIPSEDIYEALFKRKAPRPNQSTEKPIILTESELRQLYEGTNKAIDIILDFKSKGYKGECIILGDDGDCILNDLGQEITRVKLEKLKNQFVSYKKLNPTKGTSSEYAKMFVHFLNASL